MREGSIELKGMALVAEPSIDVPFSVDDSGITAWLLEKRGVMLF